LDLSFDWTIEKFSLCNWLECTQNAWDWNCDFLNYGAIEQLVLGSSFWLKMLHGFVLNWIL